MLAELARTDAHNHRPIAGDSELAEAVKVLARAHQSLVWTRQRQTNQLRSRCGSSTGALTCFDDLSSGDALAVLAVAPTPSLGRGLSRSKIASDLRRGGRQRRVEERAAEVQAALRAAQLAAPDLVSEAMGATVKALVAVIGGAQRPDRPARDDPRRPFEQHPDAKVVRSLPGLGTILGARVLGESGDDPNRDADAKSRKNYAGTSPITKTSRKHRVVLARFARNHRLADACYLWAFAALTASPGARAFYDQRREAGDTHHRALRALANRLVGILHGCLRHGVIYDEETAWAHRMQQAG